MKFPSNLCRPKILSGGTESLASWSKYYLPRFRRITCLTSANTLFIIGAEEGDHVIAANPTNPGCDGVTTPCVYGNTNGNEVGEVALNFRGLLQAESGITTSASVTNDSAPDIYLTGNPGPNDPTL